MARWQARENLKDDKNFVTYTPEQIAEAEANLKKNPPPKKKWFGKKDAEERGFFSNWAHLIGEREDYKAWKYTNKQNRADYKHAR